MTIAVLLLIFSIPALAGIGIQALAMRLIAPAVGLGRPEFMDAAGVAGREVLLAVLMFLLLNFMPMQLSVLLAVVGAVAITSIQCSNQNGIDVKAATLYVSGTLACAVAGIFLLVGLFSFGGALVGGILNGIAEKFAA